MVKSNGPYLWPSKLSQDPVVVMKFEFCAYSARLDHVFLWILSNNTGLWQCSTEKKKIQWLAIFCLYTLPLARPAQVKIQMITTSSWTVKILLHINNFNYTWHMQNNLVKSNCPTSRNIQLLYENFLIIFIGLIGMLNWKKKVIWLAVLFKTFMKRFHLHPIWVILTFWLFWSFKLEERYCTH